MILKEVDSRDRDLVELRALRAAASDCRVRSRLIREIKAIRASTCETRSPAKFLDLIAGSDLLVGLIHDVRIPDGSGGHTLIDHILIHRGKRMAWVIDTKNWSGRTICDEGSWCEWNGRWRRPVGSPVEQAERGAAGLERWLKGQNVTSIARFVPVVLLSGESRPPTNASGHIVLKPDQFSRWWTTQNPRIPSPGTLRSLVSGKMSRDDLRRLADLVITAHEPASYDWSLRLSATDEWTSEDQPGGF